MNIGTGSPKKRAQFAAFASLLVGIALFSASFPARALAQSDDSAIQADVSSALHQDSALQGQQISAKVEKGVVTLSGSVTTDAQMQAAETDASNVSGVTGIFNNLKVANPGTSPAPGLAAQASADQVNAQDQSDAQPQVGGQEQPQAEGSGEQSVPPPPPDDSQAGQYQQAPPPQYPQQRPPYQQGYGYPQGYPPQQPQVPYYSTPSSPVTVPAGTLLRVRLSEPLDTGHIKDGAYFQATAAVDVYQNGVLAIPRGALLTGQVVEAKNAGDLKGSAVLRLRLTSINLNGKVFPVSTDEWSSKGPNKAGYTAGNTAGGAVLGAIIGGIIGRGAGAAIGAGVGAAGGLAASSASKGPHVYLPAEAMLDFHLANPVTVQPVSWQEAQRLASSAPQPVLVRRPRPVYVMPGPYYGPYPYGYPYPY
jgi:hypothetical protein